MELLTTLLNEQGDGEIRNGLNASAKRRVTEDVRPVFAPFARMLIGGATATAIIATGIGLAYVLPQAADAIGSYALISAEAALLFEIAAFIFGCHDLQEVARGRLRTSSLIGAWALAMLLCVLTFFTVKVSGEISRLWVSLVAGLALIPIFACQLGFQAVARRWRAQGRLARWVAIVGGGEHAVAFMRYLSAEPDTDMHVIGYFDDRCGRIPTMVESFRWCGTTEDLRKHAAAHRVDEIIISLPWSADARILEITRKFWSLPIDVRLGPEKIAFCMPRIPQGSIGGMPVLGLVERPLSDWSLVAKAIEDRVLATILLIILFIPMLMIALLIKLDSPGPALFRQKRIGFNNKAFHVYKFRTMRHDPEGRWELKQAAWNDPRVTRVGAFLRKSSLDELPQLFNVLTGEMSLIGPRPHPAWQNAGDVWQEHGGVPLEAVVSEYARRHRVKPGITGWAQVCGFRGGTKSPEVMRKRVERDLYYIERWSIWFDIKILMLTVIAVLRSQNAY